MPKVQKCVKHNMLIPSACSFNLSPGLPHHPPRGAICTPIPGPRRSSCGRTRWLCNTSVLCAIWCPSFPLFSAICLCAMWGFLFPARR